MPVNADRNPHFLGGAGKRGTRLAVAFSQFPTFNPLWPMAAEQQALSRPSATPKAGPKASKRLAAQELLRLQCPCSLEEDSLLTLLIPCSVA
jgi:hypothetical protein